MSPRVSPDIWSSSMILHGRRTWYYIIACFLVPIMGCCLISLMCAVEAAELYSPLRAYPLLSPDHAHFKVIVHWDCGWEAKSWTSPAILRRLIYYYSSKPTVKPCWVKTSLGEKNGSLYTSNHLPRALELHQQRYQICDNPIHFHKSVVRQLISPTYQEHSRRYENKEGRSYNNARSPFPTPTRSCRPGPYNLHILVVCEQ